MRRWRLAACAATALFFFSGCASQTTFEKVDRKGHVVIKGPQGADVDDGYCFHVPADWEIRERLEGADVVCLSPPAAHFRETVVVRSLTADQLKDPQAAMATQIAELGAEAEVVEAWEGSDQPMLVNLVDSRFSKTPLSQLLFLHIKPEGNGILFCFTTHKDAMPERRAFFTDIVTKAKYDITDCPMVGAVPEVFPTPEVTLSPGLAPVAPVTPSGPSSPTPAATPTSVATPAASPATLSPNAKTGTPTPAASATP